MNRLHVERESDDDDDDRSSDTCRFVKEGFTWSLVEHAGKVLGDYCAPVRKSGKTARQTDELAIYFNELSVHLTCACGGNTSEYSTDRPDIEMLANVRRTDGRTDEFGCRG